MTVLQQGPTILGTICRHSITFFPNGSNQVYADLSSLEPGHYFLSVGRTLGDTEIQIGDGPRQRAQLIGGLPIDIDTKPANKRLIISWISQEHWRDHLYEKPEIFGYGTGLLIQEWRIFSGIFMGPLFSLILIVLALFNLRLSKESRRQITPYLTYGIASLLYNWYLSGIPDLFFRQEINTNSQVLAKALISAALVYLLTSLSKSKGVLLLSIHAIWLLGAVLYFLRVHLSLAHIYNFLLIVCTLSPLIASFDLLRLKKQTPETRLMASLGVAWASVQLFATCVHQFHGATAVTVWNPSFTAVLAVTNFFYMYRKAVTHSAEMLASKRRYRLCAQVAHDIRSPLASLSAVIHNASNLDATSRSQIEQVASRIRAIAKNLLTESDYKLAVDSADDTEAISDEPLLIASIESLTSAIVAEKKAKRNDDVEVCMHIQPGCLYLARVQATEFQRIISNLIDNALEAITDSGNVTVSIHKTKNSIEIDIVDTGKGMSQETLSNLGLRGFTFGKSNEVSGSGLGVYHAMQTLRLWDGKLTFSSSLNKGTTAKISIPSAPGLTLVDQNIDFDQIQNVIILDDDEKGHPEWSKWLKTHKLQNANFFHFSSTDHLLNWYRERHGLVDAPLYVFKHELKGDRLSGLDTIDLLNIGGCALLILERPDEVVLSRCAKSGIRVMSQKELKWSIEKVGKTEAQLT